MTLGRLGGVLCRPSLLSGCFSGMPLLTEVLLTQGVSDRLRRCGRRDERECGCSVRHRNVRIMSHRCCHGDAGFMNKEGEVCAFVSAKHAPMAATLKE